MIWKHVDLIAVALLLAAIGLCSRAHQAVLTGIQHAQVANGFEHYRSFITTQAPRIRFSLD